MAKSNRKASTERVVAARDDGALQAFLAKVAR